MDEYFGKSPNAGRKGKAAELLVAAHCILVSGGELNVSTSCVDDEGVDLVFRRRRLVAHICSPAEGQVLVRIHSSARTHPRRRCSQTFSARPDLGMLFAVVDDTEGRLVHVWLVPSHESLQGGRGANQRPLP
jgi:hypothetical protein